MTFIATPDGRNLSKFRVRQVCQTRDNITWRVRMVSSYFRNEHDDALMVSLVIPVHYDEIICVPTGNPVSLELEYEQVF